jgi:ankyrin repeat protein
MSIGFIAAAIAIFGCTTLDTVVNKKNLTGYDYRLFQGTPAWPLAESVEDEDTIKIRGIISNDKTLLNAQEPKFGETLLQIAVMTLKYNSVKTLISLGADPNSQDKYAGSSPLMEAANILLTDKGDYGSNPKYLELLLKHGGDPNSEQKGKRPPGYNVRLTPLLNACRTGYLDYIKLLVEAGADVRYDNKGMTPLFKAAFSTRNTADVVIYLIDRGADYKKPLMSRFDGVNLYITDIMRDWRFELNSPEYKKKMQLANFLKKNGMDYWKTKIPEQYLDSYPKEYLKKY